MSRKRKQLIIVLGALTLGVFVFLNIFSYRHAYAMMHFTEGGERTSKPEALNLRAKLGVLFSGVTIPRSQTPFGHKKFDPKCRALTLKGKDGIKLGAWYLNVATELGPLVILFHGYGGEKCGTMSEGLAFADMGYSVMLVDFRGSGDSSESYTTIGYLEAEDVATAVNYAREQLGHSAIVLYGKSMGAAAVMRSVHSLDVRVNAIIVEGIFDSLLNTVSHRFDAMGLPSFPAAHLLVFWGGRQFGFNGFEHNPMNYARKVRCPTLFLHGSSDPRARVDDARRVYDALPSGKHFCEFPDLGHESAITAYPEIWLESVTFFLQSMPITPREL